MVTAVSDRLSALLSACGSSRACSTISLFVSPTRGGGYGGGGGPAAGERCWKKAGERWVASGAFAPQNNCRFLGGGGPPPLGLKPPPGILPWPLFGGCAPTRPLT